MIGWIKSLFKEDQLSKDIGKVPEVKQAKGKNISEPVFAMLNAWKQNPKRFLLTSKTSILGLFNCDGIYSYRNYHKTPSYSLEVKDKESQEVFDFGIWLGSQSYSDAYNSTHFLYSRFAKHRIYPVLDSKVYSKPSWMTQDELDFIIETVKPYYIKRVNRYRDIVESRIDRTRKANELKSEIAKQKERDRLTGVYQ